MQTAKQALLAEGRIKEIKQGRISNDNHMWLLEQVAAGVKFSDYPKGGKVVVSTTNEAQVKTYVKAPAPTGEVIADLYFRYEEKDYQAVGKSGKVYSMREACNNCHYSLVGHLCDEPSVLGERVEVVRR